MAKYSFSDAQRFAIYVTHGEKCYLCSQPIDLSSMQVDHIIPESLLSDKDELEKALVSFGLSLDFDLNNYSNWMPSCGPCNRKKLATVFNPTPLIQAILQQAAEKSGKAQELAEKTVTRRQVMRALNVLKQANEAGELGDEIIQELQPLIEYQVEERVPNLQGESIKLAPLYEVLSEHNGMKIIKGPYGIGARPSGENVHSSFNCPVCGSSGAWSGARCVVCGEMSDD